MNKKNILRLAVLFVLITTSVVIYIRYYRDYAQAACVEVPDPGDPISEDYTSGQIVCNEDTYYNHVDLRVMPNQLCWLTKMEIEEVQDSDHSWCYMGQNESTKQWTLYCSAPGDEDAHCIARCVSFGM